MKACEWQRIKEVVAAALEQPRGCRFVVLEANCRTPAERQKVQAFLAAYESHPEFLEEGIGLRIPPSLPRSLEPGDRFDVYRIVRKIGSGGMGEVFEAEQLTPFRRRLALKLLRPGSQDPEGIARFEAERQVLASMGHPNIARIFAAGTFEERPFLAMELVEGLTLTEYCRAGRLSIENRIALFTDVCRGVQHAHQRGVIHRDLKPSNVLVVEQDGEPVPKIIDFGISKRTTDGAQRLTEKGDWLGTPDYMSPEQAFGETVDTRSDVYSLGVLLYELLCGCLPFDTASLRQQGLHVLLQALRYDNPMKPSRRSREPSRSGDESRGVVEERAARRGLEPSALGRRLAGDLDLVTLKALEKDPDHRYASPGELVQDLHRHLTHRPLTAVQPSAAYVLRKLLWRRRGAFAGAAVVLFSMLVGIVGLGLGLVRARQEADRARREAATSSRVTDFMWDVFRGSDPSALDAPSGVTLRQVLERGAARVHQDLQDEPLVQARLMAVIGKSYLSLGLFSSGLSLLEKSMELLEDVAPGTRDLAYTMHLLAEAHIFQANYDESLELLNRSLDIRRRVLGEEHYEVSWVLNDIGIVLSAQGNFAEDVQVSQVALELKRRIYGEEHVEVARTLTNLGWGWMENGDPERGRPLLEESLTMFQNLLGGDHQALAPTLNNLAEIDALLKNFESAELLQRRAMALDEKAFGADHPNVAFSLANLASIAWESRQDCALALDQGRAAEEIYQKHYSPEHPDRRALEEQMASFREGCPAE